jgi:hypothetical protein
MGTSDEPLEAAIKHFVSVEYVAPIPDMAKLAGVVPIPERIGEYDAKPWTDYENWP